MHVVVCVKQIPDPAVPGELDPSTHQLKREGKLILDESDSYGVEMALQLVDKAGGGEVTLVSMAPNNEVSGLRTALAMGAAKALTADGLFIGQSREFFELLRDLAEERTRRDEETRLGGKRGEGRCGKESATTPGFLANQKIRGRQKRSNCSVPSPRRHPPARRDIFVTGKWHSKDNLSPWG